MDTQFTVTYQIVDAFTGESSIVNEEYLARYHYEKSDHVTEIHTTVTLSSPFHRIVTQIARTWQEKDRDNDNYEPETEEV